MKIIVLAGGLSTERDVSISTGTMVSRALRKKGHQVLLLDVFLGIGKEGDPLCELFDQNTENTIPGGSITRTAPDAADIRAMREDQSNCFFGPNVIALCRMADIVFLALHGENGEDGRLQAAFDLFGIRYTGSGYLSSAIAMNKQLCKQFFETAAIPTAKWISMKKSERIAAFADTGLSLPCIVKPCCGGSSVGISIIHTQEDYLPALDQAFEFEDEVILENYIKGREFSVAVFEQKAFPVIEIAPKQGFYDYSNKYTPGSTVETCPADLPDATAQKLQRDAEAAAKALRIDTYCRVDFMLDENGNDYCLEVNTLPGMTPTSLIPQEAKAVGIRFADLCERIIDISMNKF
ncbi:MAG: D-alanine--D-alanine ligase [Eubacterium sp.]|nr:D-alanine--D-alanine ligase [Eubacterium sp.]